MPTPLYIHDCDDCVFLGNYKNTDLYFCNPVSVISRKSSEPSDYNSGIYDPFKDSITTALVQGSCEHLILIEALHRAEKRGLIS